MLDNDFFLTTTHVKLLVHDTFIHISKVFHPHIKTDVVSFFPFLVLCRIFLTFPILNQTAFLMQRKSAAAWFWPNGLSCKMQTQWKCIQCAALTYGSALCILLFVTLQVNGHLSIMWRWFGNLDKTDGCGNWLCDEIISSAFNFFFFLKCFVPSFVEFYISIENSCSSQSLQ